MSKTVSFYVPFFICKINPTLPATLLELGDKTSWVSKAGGLSATKSLLKQGMKGGHVTIEKPKRLHAAAREYFPEWIHPDEVAP
jgi:hypothetical protein